SITSLFVVSPPPPAYTSPLSLHDALPIWLRPRRPPDGLTRIGAAPVWLSALNDTSRSRDIRAAGVLRAGLIESRGAAHAQRPPKDRKSTRLNSSHVKISYAVFCLKKKNNK